MRMARMLGQQVLERAQCAFFIARALQLQGLVITPLLLARERIARRARRGSFAIHIRGRPTVRTVGIGIRADGVGATGSTEVTGGLGSIGLAHSRSTLSDDDAA